MPHRYIFSHLDRILAWGGSSLTGGIAVAETVQAPTSPATVSAWIAAIFTIGATIVYPKLKALYQDIKKTRRDEEAGEFEAIKTMLVDEAKIARNEAQEARNEALSIRKENARLLVQISDLTYRVEAYSAELATFREQAAKKLTKISAKTDANTDKISNIENTMSSLSNQELPVTPIS